LLTISFIEKPLGFSPRQTTGLKNPYHAVCTYLLFPTVTNTGNPEKGDMAFEKLKAHAGTRVRAEALKKLQPKY
jgi:hypothetical protein